MRAIYVLILLNFLKFLSAYRSKTMRGVSMELSNGHVSGRIAGQSSQNLIPSRPFIFLALTVQMWYWKKTFMRIYGLWNLRFDPSRCDLCLSIRGQMLGRNDWIVRDVSFASLFMWYFLFLTISYIHFFHNDLF